MGIGSRVFQLIHMRNLVYNTCWEDPRLDRTALEIGPDDNVMVITSAGCNTLDYALTGPNHVHAVDMNPRQNALLDLKIAGIRHLDYETFFDMFGKGRLRGAKRIYREKLRDRLPKKSRKYWDRKIKFFKSRRRPFYFRGTSGTFAKMMNIYIDRIVKLRPSVDALLDAKTIEEQREIYDEHVRPRLWTRPLKFAMSREATMAMLGVPRSQRDHIERSFETKIVGFIDHCLDAVFTQLPLADNYFWRVYLTSRYTRECCPEYLKEENFHRLKEGLVDRISTHTTSVQGFLEKHEDAISKFVLLDHMDWLCDKHYPILEAEWQTIVDRAAPNARIIWRSGGLHTEFVDRVHVTHGGQLRELGEMLTYHRELATELHEKDRVHTYGSFHIADLAA
jgi:S-adenosylmethionine-diacylglycerol 3-amino-3-carboxypropyl transferase